MPKKIDVTKEEILDITRNLIALEDYNNINCRYIAKKAGIGVGTLYRFFNSKMSILSTIIYEDWKDCLAIIPKNLSLEESIKTIYLTIKNFAFKYSKLWKVECKEIEIVTYKEKHLVIINEIKNILIPILNFNNLEIDDFKLAFVIDNMIRYASLFYDFDKLEKIFMNILGGDK